MRSTSFYSLEESLSLPPTFGTFWRNARANRLRESDSSLNLKISERERRGKEQLLTVIAWGRYAEIFSYDDARRMFSIDHV